MIERMKTKRRQYAIFIQALLSNFRQTTKKEKGRGSSLKLIELVFYYRFLLFLITQLV